MGLRTKFNMNCASSELVPGTEILCVIAFCSVDDFKTKFEIALFAKSGKGF